MFLDAIRAVAGGKVRVARVDLWSALRTSSPLEAGASDARERLRRHLDILSEQGQIRFPAGKSGWDRTAVPPIPEWVTLARALRPLPSVDPATVPWAPELSFVRNFSDPDLVAAALIVQGWLANGGRARPLVPMRERSVGLFGDEKRLDRLLRTPLFALDRLSLSILRCFSMAPPLVFEPGPDGTRGRPCLVIENHHTWWSFCGWNARVGQYSAVVYGAGGGFGRDAVAFLAERSREWGTDTAEYFGDLDPDGLEIPFRAATRFADGLGVRIVCAERWYRLLVAVADPSTLPRVQRYEVTESLEWLCRDVHQHVRDFFAAGTRIPQELVGADVLAAEARSDEPTDLPF